MSHIDRQITLQESKALALEALNGIPNPHVQKAAKFFVESGCNLEGIYDHGDIVSLTIPSKTDQGKTIEIKLENIDAALPSITLIELSRIDCGKYGGLYVRSIDRAVALLTNSKTGLYVEFFDNSLQTFLLTSAQKPNTKLHVHRETDTNWTFHMLKKGR